MHKWILFFAVTKVSALYPSSDLVSFSFFSNVCVHSPKRCTGLTIMVLEKGTLPGQ
jgi:hypothetical protein